ncbi:hypothetical protein [Anaeromyxobacter oryzae]|uniref:DUF5666 domain-containing protein n=1 Tax=Anaeromyxobacter oryzae TaxID=2918170 RepID=A0ABM7X0A0_9BACT|nr:hypothetical protein [Anaeromyxobacter oryzae]BDG05136.1 hypothetical protein AMOR_41320 [Anaeromyxobacter oryzae]
MARFGSVAAAAIGLAALATSASAAGQPEEHVRGVIGAVANDTVTVKGADGRAQKLKLGDETRVSFATRADLGAIAKDEFVGTTAVEGSDGSLRAVEVHVFPQAMRGTGEGHRPWDLKPGSTMTNATVASVEGSKTAPPSTMTNATVSDVAGAAGGKTLTLSYAGGEKKVLVPPGTPVVRIEPADRSALAPGQHVFAAGARQPDGTVLVNRIFVGKDGVVPPM